MFRSNLDHESRGSMLNLLKKKKNSRGIIVDTLDARLYFDIEIGSKARSIFDLVCHTIGLRETNFFGLAIELDTSDFPFWLKLDKKLFDQIAHLFKEDQKIILQFYAKYFPESAEDELLQDVTKHYFALQYQFLIQKNFIDCTYDAGELLAAFSAQIKYGNFNVIENENLWEMYKDFVPQSTLNYYNNNQEAIVKAVSMWHIKHKGMCREAAEHEYVNIVHDFPMCGVNLFDIQDSNGVNATLGVRADSVSTYPLNDKAKLNPTTTIEWNSLVDMSYTERKFTFKYALPMSENDIKKKESSLKRSFMLGSQLNLSTISLNKHNNHYYEELTFNVKNTEECKILIDICRGNHHLYMERRKLGKNMELQQMKSLALEEKDRREKERESSLKDVDIKLKFHEEKMEMKAKYNVLEKKYKETLVSLESAQNQASAKKEVEKYKERISKLQYDLEIKQQENEQLKEEVASLKKKLNRHSLGVIRSSSFKQNSPQSSAQQHLKGYRRNQMPHQDGNGYHQNNSGDYQQQQFNPQYEIEQYQMYNNQHSRSSSQASRGKHNAPQQKYHRQSPANRSYDDHHLNVEIQKSNKEYESTSSKMEQSFQELKSNIMNDHYDYSDSSGSMSNSQENLYFQAQSVDE